MNIFFLHLDPKKCAKYYFNRHCVKIILEIAQMLYTAQWTCNQDDNWINLHFESLQLKPYRKTHFNHPTAKWIRKCRVNYLYACEMGLELCREYTRRYNKTHKTQERIEWLINNIPKKFPEIEVQGRLAIINIPQGCTPVPLAMPEEYHSNDLLYSYRKYYIKGKRHVAQSEEAWQTLRREWFQY